MAQPTSAAARAGASLTPSPTIMRWPDRRRSSATASILPAGLSPLRASAMPSVAPTVRTAGPLSPLRMDEDSPIARRWWTAGPASGRNGVVTAMAPTVTPSRSTVTTVSPAS